MALTDMEKKEKLGEFLQQEFAKFVASKRRYASQVEFAGWLNVEAYNLNQWMTKNRMPTDRNLDRLAAKFGPKIYDLIEVPRRMPDDPQFRQVAERWFELPPEIRDLVMKVLARDDLTEGERSTLQAFFVAEVPA